MAEAKNAMTVDDVQEIVERFINEGATFKDIRGLSNQDMEAIYSMGFTLYNHGKYNDAHNVFEFLSFYDHLEKRYWMGLGATRQMMKNYEGAVQAYTYAAMLDVEDPNPPMHAADCFLALEKYQEAESALQATIHWAGDHEEYTGQKERAEALLQLIEKKEEGGNES